MSTRTLTEQELKARSDYLRAEEFDIGHEPRRKHLVPLNVPIGSHYSGPALCGKVVTGTTFMPETVTSPPCLACYQVAWEQTHR